MGRPLRQPGDGRILTSTLFTCVPIDPPGIQLRVGLRRAVFEYIEPASDDLPTWLDLTIPADHFVASTLRLQSAHP